MTDHQRYNKRWRQDFATYRADPRFESTLTEFFNWFKECNQVTVTPKPSKTPTLLVLIGLPGSGKSTIQKAVSQQLHFVSIESIPIMEWLMQKELNGDKWIYPSSYVTYFYKEELIKHLLGHGLSATVDLLAKKPDIYDELHKIARAKSANFQTVVLESADPKILMKRKLSTKDQATFLADWPTFAADAHERPDSDEAVFVKDHPDWAEKTYGDFSQGRWERWQQDFLAYPIEADSQNVLKFQTDQLDSNQITSSVIEWLG